jgi:hypothetical protein
MCADDVFFCSSVWLKYYITPPPIAKECTLQLGERDKEHCTPYEHETRAEMLQALGLMMQVNVNQYLQGYSQFHRKGAKSPLSSSRRNSV